jgi:uncharacterized protein YqjF (DUF2071 family)
MPRPFLSARWKNLLNLTYEVPPELLEPHCPDGVELERSDGHSFVSLVAFDFTDTRVLGVPWPGHRTFPEVNLRFYVRHGDQRGVVFLREFVPRRAVAWIARALYGEPYVRAPMSSEQRLGPDRRSFSLRLDYGGRSHELRVTADSHSTHVPPEDSPEHFFKEHAWGFGTDRLGRTRRYRVDHPKWAVYDIESLTLDVDFATLYGEEWAVLDDADPIHEIFAQGSDVTVHSSEPLDG